MSDLILYQFSRDRVEAGDAKDFLSRFGKFRVPVGKQLHGMMNNLALMIEGYDDDPREIYAIPEVRTFYQQGSMCGLRIGRWQRVILNSLPCFLHELTQVLASRRGAK